MLKNLKLQPDAVESDVLNTGGILPTDVYAGKLNWARTYTTDNGVHAIEISAEIGSKTFRDQFYVTDKNGNSAPKGVTKPDLLKMDSLARISTGKPIASLTEVEAEIPLYDFKKKKELPTEATIIKELTGVPVFLAIQEIWEDKSRKTAGGTYEPTNEIRKFNKTVKFFDDQGRTLSETMANGEATFATKWKEKNHEEVWDRRDLSKDGAAAGGTEAAPKAASGNVAGMFNK